MIRRNAQDVFARLRTILRDHSGKLTVTADKPGYFCIAVAFSPKLGKGYPVAWAKIGKAYVSYHFMPVYMFPKLLEGVSKKLKARMQGKSCFNFTSVDEGLLAELELLTTEGLSAAVKAGFGPDRT